MTISATTFASVTVNPTFTAYEISVDIRVLEWALVSIKTRGLQDSAEWDNVFAELQEGVAVWEKMTGADWDYLT